MPYVICKVKITDKWTNLMYKENLIDKYTSNYYKNQMYLKEGIK